MAKVTLPLLRLIILCIHEITVVKSGRIQFMIIPHIEMINIPSQNMTRALLIDIFRNNPVSLQTCLQRCR
ncbi:hypothetical protein SeMB42_g02146 [Synchytrium endobioticum]|uniref:Secreted protein n=1 Tax=Synchytrium endobioticum TaxID=286115 RepID=A0A507DG93_9FUNG|nr:hypothetical protein SeMB42_g02146 [Synchytrium endobioticum]